MVRIGKEAMNEPGSLQLSYLQDGGGDGDGLAVRLSRRQDRRRLFPPPGRPSGGEARPTRSRCRGRSRSCIDRSGSMTGEKFQQAKAAALQIIEGLEDGEAFNMIDYSDYLASFAQAGPEEQGDMPKMPGDYIGRLAAGGMTNLHDALAEALRPCPATACCRSCSS